MASLSLSLSLSLCVSLRPNHRHHHPATIKSKPRSVYLPCAFFVFILMIDWSQNLDEAKTQIKPKPRPIQPKTQGWSERRLQRLIRPIPLLRLWRLIGASSGSRWSWRWRRGRHVLHLLDGWELTNVEKMFEERRVYRCVVKAKSEWGVRERRKKKQR